MKIIWLSQAIKAFIKTAEYVRDQFGRTTELELYDEVNEYNVYLCQNPYLGHKEPLLDGRKIDYRSVIVKRYNKIIYYIENDIVKVIDFWNLRQNSEKLQKRIK